MKFPLKKSLLVYHGTNTKSGLGQKSGFYPGTYTSKSKEVAQGFGENVETLQVDSSKIFPLADADDLKRKASKAGFGFHGANGRSEANYLKSHGYIGMARGNEVILFPFKKQSVRSYIAKNLSAKLRLREFVRVMGGADIPASMSQIRSVWRTFKNAAPGKIVRSTTQGSSFGPRGMVVQKAASGAKIDREALLAGATNTTNYPITSALHEGGHALFNKAMTGSANQQFLPRLGRGPTPEKHPLRGVQIMANEIGANNSAVQVLRGAGVKQDAVSDFMKFRQRGIDSHMRSARDHVAAAPVGLTPQRHQEIKGAFNRWITDWKRSPASPNAKLSVDAPELVKKDFEAVKLRLRELARGDYAIPALGKMLRDRSMLEEFLTGNRGPKMGDFRSFRWGPPLDLGGKAPIRGKTAIVPLHGTWVGTEPVVAVIKNQGMLRQESREQLAKMLRKGRAGGDVYEGIDRRFFSAKLRLRELARGDYAIPALGKMLRDRSMLEEFLTGNRGLGDLRAGKLRGWHNNIRLISQKPIFASNSRIGNFTESVNDAARNSTLRAREGDDFLQKETQARTAARNQLAKIIRKGRSGGDVYDEIDRGKFSGRLVGDHGLSAKLRLIEMGYTKPGLRDRIKARIMASGKGGRPGQWSARKAQLVAQEYRAEGGGYKGGKTESQKSLRKWTREKWGTRSGKPSTQGSEATGERYLPESANKSLSPQEYGATTRAKREGTRRGEQFVRQPERIAKKTAKERQ